MKVAYCTGFWCTNIGNGFFSMGTEYVLKKAFGEKNVTVVSDFQTYTTSYGKRLCPDKNQLEYISALDVDYIVLAGPVLSKYFLGLWKDILLKLNKRGIGYILLSAGEMKMTDSARQEIKEFFAQCPPYVLSSRDETVYKEYAAYAKCAYNGICFSFYVPDCYNPAKMKTLNPYVIYNFDKISEPEIWKEGEKNKHASNKFEFCGATYNIAYPKLMTAAAKTDRFTDALVYIESMLPAKKHSDEMGEYRVIRTDHRFHPHFRSKIYRQGNSFVADLPYGYLNLYANTRLTLSDRVHACAVTLAFGNSAMLFAKTSRLGLLGRAGAKDICEHPVQLDMKLLEEEKAKQMGWLQKVF